MMRFICVFRKRLALRTIYRDTNTRSEKKSAVGVMAEKRVILTIVMDWFFVVVLFVFVLLPSDLRQFVVFPVNDKAARHLVCGSPHVTQ